MEGASNRFPDLGIRDISQSKIAYWDEMVRNQNYTYSANTVL